MSGLAAEASYAGVTPIGSLANFLDFSIPTPLGSRSLASDPYRNVLRPRAPNPNRRIIRARCH